MHREKTGYVWVNAELFCQFSFGIGQGAELAFASGLPEWNRFERLMSSAYMFHAAYPFHASGLEIRFCPVPRVQSRAGLFLAHRCSLNGWRDWVRSSIHARTSASAQAIRPGEILTGGGKSPDLTCRHKVVLLHEIERQTSRLLRNRRGTGELLIEDSRFIA